MRIQVNSRSEPFHLRLGFQTRPFDVVAAIKRKANKWAPKAAKSFSIKDIDHDAEMPFFRPRNGKITGYGSFSVTYYTTKEEGKFLIDKRAK